MLLDQLSSIWHITGITWLAFCVPHLLVNMFSWLSLDAWKYSLISKVRRVVDSKSLSDIQNTDRGKKTSVTSKIQFIFFSESRPLWARPIALSIELPIFTQFFYQNESEWILNRHIHRQRRHAYHTVIRRRKSRALIINLQYEHEHIYSDILIIRIRDDHK